MKCHHKNLIVSVIAIGLIYAAIQTPIFKADREISTDEPLKNTRFAPSYSRDSPNASRHQLRRRSKILSQAELDSFLMGTVIPEVKFININLSEALRELNQLIADQIADDKPRPKIKLVLPGGYKSPSVVGFTSASPQYFFTHDPKIAELRVRETPLLNIIKYLCDATKYTFWSYKGDIYLSPYGLASSYTFYHERTFPQIHLQNTQASALSKRLNDMVDHHDFFGPKIFVSVMMSKDAKAALMSSQVTLPTIDLNLKNTSLADALLTISTEHKDTFHVTRTGELVFDPLRQMPEEILKNPDPFTDPRYPQPVNNGTFNVPLDESWNKPLDQIDPHE